MTLSGKIGLGMTVSLALAMLLVTVLPGWTDYSLAVSDQSNLPPAIFNNFKSAGDLAGLSPDSAYASRICLLGTDELGRDYLSGLIRASFFSLSFSLGIAVLSIFIAASLASLCAWYGGWLDGAIMRVVDIIFALPSIVSIVLLMAIFGSEPANLFVVLLCFGWYSEVKVLRSRMMLERSLASGEAAAQSRKGFFRSLVGQLLPHVSSVIWTLLALRIFVLVLQESFLSYLGFGPSPPFISWGMLLRNSMTSLDYAGHRLFACFAIIAWFLIGLSLFFDGLAKRSGTKS